MSITKHSKFDVSKPAKKPTLQYHHVTIEKYKPILYPKNLSPEKRQQLWQKIQTEQPALAEMLKNDPIIAALKSEFDAQIVFYEDEVSI